MPIAIQRLRRARSPKNITAARVVNNGLIKANAVASASGIIAIATYHAIILPALKKERTKWMRNLLVRMGLKRVRSNHGR